MKLIATVLVFLLGCGGDATGGGDATPPVCEVPGMERCGCDTDAGVHVPGVLVCARDRDSGALSLVCRCW